MLTTGLLEASNATNKQTNKPKFVIDKLALHQNQQFTYFLRRRQTADVNFLT